MQRNSSTLFEAYTRNLRRVYWCEFVDSQCQAARPAQFRASLVDPPLPDTDNLAPAYEYHRHRTMANEKA